MSAFALRPHQIECLDKLAAALKSGKKSPLLVMATGGGKTVTFLEQVRRTLPERVLIIAHREELITQPIETARRFFPDLANKMGIVKAERDDYAAPVVVATVQTLNAAGRLDRILSAGCPALVVIDECHHATAASYMSVIDRVRAINPRAVVLGVTATPERTDQDGLRRVFDCSPFRLDIREAVSRGILVPFDALGIGVQIDLSTLKATPDGWESEALGELLSADNIQEIIFNSWQEHCAGLLTIGFTASVRQAERLADYFAARGVSAAAVSGKTPREERARILDQFRRGEITALFNCMVLTEGFDAPEASACLMAAPTKSDLIYIQRMGRVLRTAPGKTRAIILDFAPVEERQIVAAEDVLGVPRRVKAASEEAMRQGVLISGLSVDDFGRSCSIPMSKIVVKTLELLGRSAVAWSLSGLMATAGLSEKLIAVIVLPDPARVEKAEELKRDRPERWNARAERLYEHVKSVKLYRVEKGENGRWSCRLELTTEKPSDAKRSVDSWGCNTGTLAKKDAGWRTRPATEKQVEMLRRWSVEYPETGMSCGEAAQRITQARGLKMAGDAEKTLEAAIREGLA